MIRNTAAALATVLYFTSTALAVDVVPIKFNATVVKVTDGDTVAVKIAVRPPPFDVIFGAISIRIAGIDTPESRRPPAKCALEVKRGKDASAFAKMLVKAGDTITVTFRDVDKYGGRLDGDVRLPDGRDWAEVMIKAGLAAPYFGTGPKKNWCRRDVKKSP